MIRRLRLTAASTQAGSLSVVPDAVNVSLTAETAGRTIAGIVLPWGSAGRTSAGTLRARRGSIRLPADLSRVKLFGLGHDRETPVGHAVSAHDVAAGLVMAFRIAPTPGGDLALIEASSHARDAFSVELDDVDLDGDQIIRADLSGVALVSVPAWADARVESVAAAAANREEYEMARRLATLLAAAPTGEDDERTRTTTTVETSTPPAPQPGQPGQGDEDDDDEDDDGDETPPTQTTVRAAAAPRGVGAPPRGRAGGRQLRTLYAAMAAHATDSRLGPDLTAALADITHTANAWVQPTQYDGQLWSGVAYQRQIVPLFTQRPLTSYKIAGWRWKVKPEVGDYAGDKAEVPTNPAVTEEANTTAKRLAGAHDIDRKFRDFGDAGFFQSYYEAMAESYAVQSDDRAADFLIASATALALPGADLITAVTTAAFQIQNQTGSPATFALVNQVDWLALMIGTTADEAPAWLSLLPVPISAFKPSPIVAQGSTIVGAKPAISWYEREGSPIRVETVDLAHGGIDGGVFGYYATLLNDARGLLKATFGGVAEDASSRSSKSSKSS